MGRHALLVGIDGYLMLSELKYARADAEAFAGMLRDKCGFRENEITLMSCQANGAERAISHYVDVALQSVAKEEGLDLLIFGFWGHGFRPTPDEHYLCAQDTEPNAIKKTAIPLKLVQTRLSQAEARNTLIVLDCCQDRPPQKGRSGTGSVLEEGTEAAFDALARNIAAVRTGPEPTVAIMSACKEGQRAHAWDSEKHGIFTYHLLEGVRQGCVSVAELSRHVATEVPKTARRICRAEQAPHFKLEGLGDIQLVTAKPAPPKRSAAQWWYAQGDREAGPASIAQLKKLVRDGALTARTEVWREGMGEWAAAGKVRELAGLFPAPVGETTPPRRSRRTNAPAPGTTRSFAGINMVWCPPGEFMMGSPDSDGSATSDEKPQHRVRITQGFWLGAYPVSQAQWISVMVSRRPSAFKGDSLPVENVTWDDCSRLLDALTSKGEGHFRFPTEAEWEYACRAGSQTRFCGGDGESRLDRYAWFDKHAPGPLVSDVQRKPNAWGIYDMHGNVWEWCQDWYGPYRPGYAEDPKGPVSGIKRIIRGGAFNSFAAYCRSAKRAAQRPAEGLPTIGLRVALSL